jgi:hypothetical protein
LQKEKEKFASPLQAKRKISEKLEQLNQAREQIETIQTQIDQMKEQENSSLWQDSPHQNSGPTRTTPERKFLRGKWNLTVRRFRVTTVHRAANRTMAAEIQASFSPEI